MTQALANVFRALPREAIDDVLVQSITSEMQTRLAEKRAEGRSGWQGSDCSNAELLRLLRKNLGHGDMIDVINLAGMIHLRALALGECIPLPPSEPLTMTHLTHGSVDVRAPSMVRIAADGTAAKHGAGHVAVLLPQYGLMFSAEEPRKAKTHDEAVRFARETQLLGFTDWRLPEVEELQLLVHRSKSKPAIDSGAFPHTPTDDWYWSNTIHASAPGYAWSVGFGNGYVGDGRRSFSGFVRAVRSVSPSQ